MPTIVGAQSPEKNWCHFGFFARPLRLLSADIQDKNGDGKIQLLESLRFRLQLRNFSEKVLSGKTVKLVLSSDQIKLINAPISKEVLVKDLRERSLTIVSDALDFSLKKDALGKAVKVKIQVLLNDKLMGEQVLELVSKQ